MKAMAEAGIHVVVSPAGIGSTLVRIIGKAPFFHCGQSSKGLPSW
jgi:hypothetical protein